MSGHLFSPASPWTGFGWPFGDHHSTECPCFEMSEWREKTAARERWYMEVAAERSRQIEKGYTQAHDAEHGDDHLLLWAQEYARRGEPVKSAALIEAARELLMVSRIPADEPRADSTGNPK